MGINFAIVFNIEEGTANLYKINYFIFYCRKNYIWIAIGSKSFQIDISILNINNNHKNILKLMEAKNLEKICCLLYLQGKNFQPN